MTNQSSIISNRETSIDAVYTALKNSQQILVVSHIDPDGDAIGTQLAFVKYLKDLGKQVIALRDSEIPSKYLFLEGIEEIQNVNSLDTPPEIDTALVLECPLLDRMGDVQKLLSDDITVISIDHHLDNDGYGAVNWLDIKASSVGEMACEFFERVNYQLSPVTAEQLYTAILTDTGRLRFSSTTPRTMELAGRLIESGANPPRIHEMVYYNYRQSTVRLIGKVVSGIEFPFNGKACLLTITRQMLEETGGNRIETEGFVDYTLYSEGVVVGALLKEETDNQTKVSFRSKGDINVAELAGRFGGGGHFNASGCTLLMSLSLTKEEVLKLLKEVLSA